MNSIHVPIKRVVLKYGNYITWLSTLFFLAVSARGSTANAECRMQRPKSRHSGPHEFDYTRVKGVQQGVFRGTTGDTSWRYVEKDMLYTREVNVGTLWRVQNHIQHSCEVVKGKVERTSHSLCFQDSDNDEKRGTTRQVRVSNVLVFSRVLIFCVSVV